MPRKKKKEESDDSDSDFEDVGDGDTSFSAPHLNTEEEDIEKTYQKKSLHDQIIIRPDTYIGSVEPLTEERWVWDSSKKAMVYKKITFVPGLYKIFDEILVNAADNKIRSPEMNKIKVTIDKEAGRISVWNNGRGIPVEIHKEHNVYVPTLIFGHLLTGSNFDDDKKKVTGGRNGYGAKLANIFSHEFIVETVDSKRGKKFRQVWKNNMMETDEPKITKSKKDDYTEVTFVPDLSKFHMTELDDDTVALLTKRVYDVAGTTAKDVAVYLNGSKVPVKCFKDYVKLYALDKKVVYEDVNDRWSVAMCVSDGQPQQVSFVNSICTTRGGKHVQHVTSQISKYLLQHVERKNRSVPLKLHHIKNHIFVFVNSLIENPAFDSQTKETLNTQVSKFGSKCQLSEKFLKAVLKCGIVDAILSYAKYKEGDALKTKSGRKRARISGIAKLCDANDAGGKYSEQCTLILTEGDSAKALAIAGLSVLGRDRYGVFPLKGKPLNVRDAKLQRTMKNAELDAITQIMGLKHKKKYTKENLKELRYGSIMLMADQDHDGSHIKGLIMNWLHKFWPELLMIDGFLKEFITPIVKCKHRRSKQVKVFFTMPEYLAWKEETDGGKGWDVKYYKGLGTSNADEAREYFSNLRVHKISFKWEDKAAEKIELAFAKEKVEERKNWLNTYKEGEFLDHSKRVVKYTDFFDKEMILFSIADNARSIPNIMDGFKPSQRKVLFGCIKRKLKKEIKVSQLTGYVSMHTAYHHGEQSLVGTIVGMAQDFVGANNINLLMPNGMFGTRLMGGKDAASARYIHTALSDITRYIFREEDDQILDYLDEDGQSIEPRWYAPIIPMVLVNGSEGIGTGWSTSIPNYNPLDIVENIKRMIKGEEPTDMVPWFKGFSGKIEHQKAGTWISKGIINKINDTTVEITELPIKKWTQDYTEFLEEKMMGGGKEDPKIEEFREYHTENKVNYTIFLSPEQMKAAEEVGLEKYFKLTSYVHCSNMTLFTPDGKLKTYSSPIEIMKDYYEVRLKYYEKRKEAMLKKLKAEFDLLDNRVRFILMVINGELVIKKRKKSDILRDLKKHGFTPFPKEKKKKVVKDPDEIEEEESEEEETDDDKNAYNYLLSMPLWSLTHEKVQELQKKKSEKQNELEKLGATKVTDLWLKDLDEFVEKLKEVEAKQAKLQEKREKQFKAKPKTIKRTKKRVTKKSTKKSSDDESSESTKKTTKKATTKKTTTKKATTSKKRKRKDEDDDEVSTKTEESETKTEDEEEGSSLLERMRKQTGVTLNTITKKRGRPKKETKKETKKTVKEETMDTSLDLVDISDSEDEKKESTQVRSRANNPPKKRRKLATKKETGSRSITEFFSKSPAQRTYTRRKKTQPEEDEEEETKEESKKKDKDDSIVEELKIDDSMEISKEEIEKLEDSILETSTVSKNLDESYVPSDDENDSDFEE